MHHQRVQRSNGEGSCVLGRGGTFEAQRLLALFLQLSRVATSTEPRQFAISLGNPQ